MKLKLWMITTLSVLQFAVCVPAQDIATNPPAATQVAPAAVDQSAEIQALKQEIQLLEQKVNALEKKQVAQPQSEQVQELDQKVRVLERQRELDQQAAAEAAKAQPRLSLGANGFVFSSADSNFVAQLHGTIQVDSRTFQNDNHIAGNDSFLLRRARPIFSGTVARDFDFMFVPEFGNGTPGSSSSATSPSIFDA